MEGIFNASIQPQTATQQPGLFRFQQIIGVKIYTPIYFGSNEAIFLGKSD